MLATVKIDIEVPPGATIIMGLSSRVSDGLNAVLMLSGQ